MYKVVYITRDDTGGIKKVDLFDTERPEQSRVIERLEDDPRSLAPVTALDKKTIAAMCEDDPSIAALPYVPLKWISEGRPLDKDTPPSAMEDTRTDAEREYDRRKEKGSVL